MRILCLLLLALLMAPALLAHPMRGALAPEERQAAALQHEARCYRVMNQLDLTPKQKVLLLPILRLHVADQIAIRDAQVKAALNAEKAMQGLRSTVYTNNGVPDAVKNTVYRAALPYAGAAQQLREKTGPERALEVFALLTTQQGARLRRLMHGNYLDDAALCAAIAKTMPQSSRSASVGDMLIGIYWRYGLMPEEIIEAKKFGAPILTEWTLLSPGEASASREAYLGKLFALPDKGILMVKRDPQLASFIQETILTQKTLHYLDPAVPLPSEDDPMTAAYLAAEKDVQVLNLLNTLYLSPEQTRNLLTLQAKMTPQYAALQAKRLQNVKASIPVLAIVRDAYAQGSTNAGLLTERMKPFADVEAAIVTEEEKLDAAGLAALRGYITENQVEMIANFVPCTVPVQSLTNPERVGQASDNTALEQSLAKLRDLPERELKRGIFNLQNSIQAAFEHKHRSPAEIEAVTALVPQIAEDIRLMDDTEFAMKKCELAKKLAVPEYTATGEALDARIVYYLLAPNLTPILKSREGATT